MSELALRHAPLDSEQNTRTVKRLARYSSKLRLIMVSFHIFYLYYRTVAGYKDSNGAVLH